jgi:CBS domain-containing protein
MPARSCRRAQRGFAYRPRTYSDCLIVRFVVVPQPPVVEAVQIMLQKGISGLPVTYKDGSLAGIVTEGDFLRRIETGTQRRRPRRLEFLVGSGQLADEYTHFHGRKVQDAMTRDVVTASEDAPLEELVDLMEHHGIKRVPIVRGQRLIGIITRANLLHALASLSREVQPSAQSDETIRRLLLTEFGKQKWTPIPPVYINPIVRYGVVELWGAITDKRERRALIVAAENILGVKAVRDHIVLIDPISGMILSEPEDPS